MRWGGAGGTPVGNGDQASVTLVRIGVEAPTRVPFCGTVGKYLYSDRLGSTQVRRGRGGGALLSACLCFILRHSMMCVIEPAGLCRD